MADFQANITNGASRSVWVDDAVPSRINPLPDRQQTFWQVNVGDTVTITATVGASVAPLDAALAGRLFYPKWAEWPTGYAPPATTVTPGQSSVMTFVPLWVGHYCIVMKRPDGGGIMIPFEVGNIA